MKEDIKSKFHLMLFAEQEKLSELWLPETAEGYFCFSNQYSHQFVSITVKNNKWVAVCKNSAYFANVSLGNNFEIDLMDDQLLEVDYKDNNYWLYVEEICKEDRVFRNYSLDDNTEITIGNDVHNDICYRSSYGSNIYVSIKRVGRKFYISDMSKKSGVFVNGLKTIGTELKTGDIVSLLGLKIIIGPEVLSVNNPRERVAINHGKLKKLILSYRYFCFPQDDNQVLDGRAVV